MLHLLNSGREFTEPTDINGLHDLKDALDETVARFDMLEEEEDKIDFKIKAKQFVKLYGQLACIMPFANPDEQNRRIALESLSSKAVNKERKKDLGLHKIYAGDPDFKKTFEESIIRALALQEKSKPA